MISKILTAVDRTHNSKLVFDTAVSLAKTTGANLMFLHILSEKEPDYPIAPTYSYYPIVEKTPYETYQQEYDRYVEHGLEFLRNLSREANAQGVDPEFTQLAGNPGRMICELANSCSADLIIVGSRGLRGLKEIFLGSVSNYVTHHAFCSVLIVRQPIDTEPEAELSELDKTDSELVTSKRGDPND